MRKNVFHVISFLVLLAIAVTGCAPAATQPTTVAAEPVVVATEPAAVATEAGGKSAPFVVGVSNVSVANSFRVQMIEEIKYYASQNPDMIKEVIVTDAGGDANKQISDIEDLVTRGVDLLLVAPASDTALTPAVDAAVEAGIPVVVFNSDMVSDKVSVRVFPPYNSWANITTDWLGKELKGKGDVIALRGIAGLAAEADEWAGVEEALKNYPDVKIICTEYADWAYDKAKTAMANCLANKPKVDGVLSIGDAMTWAAAEVLKEQGYDVTAIPMIGIGGSNGFIKYWKANNLNAYVIADPTDIGVTALKAGLDLLQGKEVSATLTPTQYDITKENLDSFYKPEIPDSGWVGTILPDDVLKSILGQ